MAATITIVPADVNYKVRHGDDFADSVRIKEGDPPEPIDLSDRTFVARVLDRPSGSVVAVMNIDMDAASEGVVVYSMSSTTTQGLNEGRYSWDFKQSINGFMRTLMAGSFTFERAL